jgi:pimeloyl-ACP methyl ester carboxylesterase
MPLPARLSDTYLMARRVIYLHGFASSPQSTKASYFGERLAAHGLALECPDFNLPEFATMTMTRMLDQLGALIDAGSRDSIALIGSSLGGTLAILAVARFVTSITKLVLLAPAVMFAKERHHLLPPERVEEWRRRGALPFFHYGAGVERDLNFAFYEDSLRYTPFETTFSQPTLIYQGRRDQSVDPVTVEQFARTRPNVQLTLLDDDHQLTASLPVMWRGMEPFLLAS